MTKLKVALTGASGRMGQTAQNAIRSTADEMELALKVDYKGRDGAHNELTETLLQTVKPDVLVDLSVAAAAPVHALAALRNGVSVVIGVTGIEESKLSEIERACETYHVGALLVPNFAIGAILMMRFAAQAARFFPDVEIIEMHHEKKRDAPSGTALKTAEGILKERRGAPYRLSEETLKLEGARGAELGGIHLHSVRLPGLVAHQTVMFGGKGEQLTLRHDSMDRSSFEPGILLAIREVKTLKGLVRGLEGLV